VDAIDAAGAGAVTYPYPTGAVFLRITSTEGPLYVNFNGTAAPPAANVTNGSASQMILSHLRSILLPIPNTSLPLSIYTGVANTITIEAWN
jgi:hypothetical protein